MAIKWRQNGKKMAKKDEKIVIKLKNMAIKWR